MTTRERLNAWLDFGNPDRALYFSMRAPIPTMERWEQEGYPEGTDMSEYFGLDAMLTGHWMMSYQFGVWPKNASTIVEETEEYVIRKDTLGALVQTHKSRRDYGGVHYLDFPVKDKATFDKVKPFYDPTDPGRVPSNWGEKVEQWAKRDYPLLFSIPGPFSFIRGLMGMEGLCIATHEQPALIEDMVEFLTAFVTESLDRALRDVEVDVLLFGAEDMAYKNASMISPKSVRRFMFESYRRITESGLRNGARNIMLDSDGNVDELIPVWMDAGIQSLLPFEAAAGMDPVGLRKKFPRLGMMGGIDKRVLSKGRSAIETEVMAKVPPLLESGGYIPAVDHIISPDIPLDGFRYYTELIREIAEG